MSDFINQRTTDGAFLRSALESATKVALAIPEGRKGVVAVAASKDGVSLGAAYLTPQGWQFNHQLQGVIRDKRLHEVVFTTSVVF